MRVALLADIHGNSPALQAVLTDVKKQGVDQLWCLGDVFGYGPLPVSCVNWLDEWTPPVWLMGNHDLAALRLWEGWDRDDAVVRGLAPGLEERLVAQWHAAQLGIGLSGERIQELKDVPTWQRVTSEVYVAHGAILSSDSQDVANIMGGNSYCDARSAGRDLTLQTVQGLAGENLPHLIVVGHTHVSTVGQATRWEAPRQWVWQAGHEVPFNQPEPMPLQGLDSQPVVLCPGSVGQPRFVGKDGRAAYAILDLEKWAVRFRRAPYDQKETEAAMVPMPKALAEDLASQQVAGSMRSG